MPLRVYRRGRNYWVRGTVPGRRAIRQSLHTRNAEVAHRRAAKIELGADMGKDPVAWPEFAEMFLAGYAGATRVRYARVLDRVQRHMESLGLDYVGDATSLALERHVRSRGLSPNSLRREIGHLRTIWAWAVKHGVAASNIAALVKPPPERRVETQPFSREEMARLESAVQKLDSLPTLAGRGDLLRLRLEAAFHVLRSTGIRVSDLVQLRPAQIRDGYLSLAQHKTGGQIRLPLVESACRALANLPVQGSGYWFWSGRSLKAACDGVWRSFVRLGRRAGVENSHPHRFRDTFAVNLLLSGADLRFVSRLLGHTSIRTTEKHYAPWVQAFQDQADDAVRRAEDRYKSGTLSDRSA